MILPSSISQHLIATPLEPAFLDKSFTWDLNTVFSHKQVLSHIFARSFNSPIVKASHSVKGKMKLIKTIEEISLISNLPNQASHLRFV